MQTRVPSQSTIVTAKQPPRWYCVRIGTAGGRPLLGSWDTGRCTLSLEGEIARLQWFQIPKHCPLLSLDVLRILPDALIGIVQVRQRRRRLPEWITEPDPEVVLENAVLDFVHASSHQMSTARGVLTLPAWDEHFTYVLVGSEEIEESRTEILLGRPLYAVTSVH